ncbi:MAG TPA: gliding motility-associated C-terminal domain-containing protein [Saprospiraceae bacterium]|nr:gliding motility-associated C-terminal domain-containing protein [Saprospiraceae bacterium]HMQ83643.1 gliding motility-associated C-terminal domain-containing protein [Saprospiraceae bacterium]
MKRPIVLIVALLSLTLPLLAQMPGNISRNNAGEQRPAGQRFMMCNDAGSISFGALIGQSNDPTPDTIYLCMGDTLPVIHNGDFDLSGDPNPLTFPGVGYAFYDCPPTVNGPSIDDIIADPCLNQTDPLTFMGIDFPLTDDIWLAIEEINGNIRLINNGFHQEAFNQGVPAPILLWLAPITIDNYFFREYEGNPVGSCVNVREDQAFAVVYLEEMVITQTIPDFGAGLQGAFVVEGGLPEFDPTTSYNSISIVSTTPGGPVGIVQTPNPGHGDQITFVVPQPGFYEVTVEDGKSCGLVDTIGMPVIFNMPVANGVPGTNVCVPVSVENFFDITNAQFTIEWDPTILDFTDIQNLNPSLPALNMASFNTLPAITDNGMLTFAWADLLGGSNTLPDGSILFEVCFDVIGNIGDISDVIFTDTPTDIQVGNPNNDPSAYPFILNNGQVFVSSSALLVLVEQDSVSCPGFSDGAFTVTAAGGIAPYTFTWNTVPPSGPNNGPETIAMSGGSFTVGGLPAGDYSITVTDSENPANMEIVTIEILQGPSLGVNLLTQLPACFGESTGMVTAQVVPPPTPSFNFQWNIPAGNVSVLNNVPAGFYAVTVTDGSGCMAMASATLFNPQEMLVNEIITDATCSGSGDGDIEVNVLGGTPTAGGTYNFNWSTSLNEDAASSTLPNLDEGTYDLTVTDDNGCTIEETYSLNSIKQLSVNAFVTDITCFGFADGTIAANGSTSGAPPFGPFTFNWNTTATTGTINNLTAGQYIVTLTDSDPAGCMVVDTFVVSEPAQLIAQVLTFNNETCANGGSDGSITLQVTGGTYPYSYDWSDGQTDSIAVNLPAGNYLVAVSDANNCTSNISQTIIAPTPPSIDQLDNTTLDCADDTDGTLTVVASVGGAPIVSYVWDNGDTGATISGLSPGTYTVTVTAQDGCFSVGTAEVIAPLPLVIDNISSVSPSCPEGDNGSLTAFVSGGTTPYSFSWSSDPGNDIFQVNPGLTAGTYTVTVSDANNCPPVTAQGTVVDPASIVLSFGPTQSVSCFQDVCDGQASVSAMFSDGSAGLFNFIWESGETTMNAASSNANQLCKDFQTVVVTDQNGCAEVDSIFIPSPAPISILVDDEPVSCNGEADGSIDLAVSGGTGPYTYFWLQTGQTTSMIDGLDAGNYNVTVTDANGCQEDQEVTITEPDPLILSIDLANTMDVQCFGEESGTLAVLYNSQDMVNPLGPDPYTWSSNVPVGSTTPGLPIATNLPAGTYTVTITDIKGCQDDISFTLNEPEQIMAVIPDPADPVCADATTLVMIDTVFGGAGMSLADYTYIVDNNGLPLPIDIPAEIFGDGDHEIEIIDPNGCSGFFTVNIDQPDEIVVTFPEPVVEIELGDTTVRLQPIVLPLSTQVVSYLWTPSDYLLSDTIRNPLVFPLGNIVYTLSVVDINGCTGQGSVEVELDANRNIYIPNAFSPNGDGTNDEFRIFPCLGVTEIKNVGIFDRWGGMVYQDDNISLANGFFCANGVVLWDGEVGGQKMNMGVYVYVIEVEFLDGVTLTYRGDIHLVR